MNGIFHFLSSNDVIRVALKVPKFNLIVSSTIRLENSKGWRIICVNVFFKKVCMYRYKYLLITSILKLKMRVLPGKYENFQIIL